MLRISICIDVPDLGGATSFYCEALGFSLAEEKTTHNTLEAGGSTLHLALKEEGSNAAGPETQRAYRRHWTPVHLDFYVEDIGPFLPKIEALSGVVESTKDGDWGAAAFCSDPYGNGFCLIAMSS